MKVALVLATSTGGVGTHVRDLADALGAEATVCGPAATERLFGFAVTGARFVPVEDARALVALRRALRDVDVVHAHGLRAGLLGALARRRSTPYVVTWHNLVSGWPVLQRRVAVAADVTLAVSGDLAMRVRELGGRDVRLAPVGARPLPPARRSRDDVRTELGAGSRAVVLAVGRLHRQKGFDLLAEAARRWPALVVVAGEGPARSELEAMLPDNMVLLGRRDDIADLLAAADIVVLPSRWEGSPLAAHEALQAGRPLVAASVGGLPDLLGGGAAMLVPPEDAGALARAVLELLERPALADRYAAAGRARAAEWPSAAASVAAVQAVYAELLG